MAAQTVGTDVFVVGGGPAGLAAAVAARRRGLSVTVADGAVPPIDKACGEGLLPAALEALRELGISVFPSDGYCLRGICFFHRAEHASGQFPIGAGLGIRRTVLHQRLTSMAESSGVRLLWRTPVLGISRGGVQLPGYFMKARWIVGADGGGSRVRQWAGLAARSPKSQRFANRRHFRLSPWSEYVEIYWQGATQAYVTPVSSNEVCVVVLGETPEAAEFDSFLENCSPLRARLTGAQTIGKERGASTRMHSISAPVSGNIALVGDASGGVDAITGEGLRLAFRQAIALADALANGDIRPYAALHRKLTRRPMLTGALLLTLGRNERIRTRAIRMLANRPPLFGRMLALHSGEADLKSLLTAGLHVGLGLLTT